MLPRAEEAVARGALNDRPLLKKSKTGQKRVSRACLNCRKSKTKCELDKNGGTPPCRRCVTAHRECVLGSSNRGGRRNRKNQAASTGLSRQNPLPSQTQSKQPDLAIIAMNNSDHHPFASGYDGLGQPGQPDRRSPIDIDDEDESEADSITDSAIGASVTCNPSDSWQCLKHVGKRAFEGNKPDKTGPPSHHTSTEVFIQTNGSHHAGVSSYPGKLGLESYRLVRNGALDRNMVWSLVSRYGRHYHPYFPLVPRKYFDPANLDTFAATEKHLLTAVLMVASKDLADFGHVHEICSKYMLELISDITGGGDCDVEAVEALLIIAEWEPQGLRPDLEGVGRGEEDRAAWMHVALALRAGYFLDLERTSFRGDPSGDSEIFRRKRLAWISCYISDRLVSVRNGKGFWSRGPGPTSGLVDHDFPSLKPVTPDEDDYARILQATLELTQLYGNVHDVLYSGMRTSIQIMLQGDYVKYVDDFRKAIALWNDRWETLNCSFHLKMALKMSYDYLRLYTNAFAFQAAITQASKPEKDPSTQRERIRAAFKDVASMQDARFIYESVQAAQSCLNIFIDSNLQPYLPFMPLRYYLYAIFAAVFLYKARSFGVLKADEETDVRQSVTQTMKRLDRASVTGRRYARLLDLLWNRKSFTAPCRPRQSADLSLTALTSPLQEINFTPAHEFSWLDIRGVADYSIDPTPSDGMLGIDPSYQGVGPYTFEQQGATTSWLFDQSGNPINTIVF
ncbi:hypothetical protein VTO42DRAFT_9072 [Malbranchea cinnamomea]